SVRISGAPLFSLSSVVACLIFRVQSKYLCLCLIICICFASEVSPLVPSTWTEAHIQPVLKKGKDKKGPENYRPISLLSCTGKLMERLINRRLMWFLETNSALSPTQTGYRQFRNTEDQLTYLSQDIENAFQDRKQVL